IVAWTLMPLAVRELLVVRLRMGPRLTVASTPRSSPPKEMLPRSGTETVVVTLKELKVGSWTVLAGRFWRGGCGGACAYTRDAQPRRIAVNASDRMRTSVQPSLD